MDEMTHYPPAATQGGTAPPGPITNPPIPGAGYPRSGEKDPAPGMQQPPAAGNYIPVPVGSLVGPPGLEYLGMIDKLIIHQNVDLLSAFLGFRSPNRYLIKNTVNQVIYNATEDSECCSRNCLGVYRPFDMNITDYAGNEVIRFYRPLKCDGCCCPCCLQVLKVMSPPGILIGSVEEEWSFLYPNFKVLNAAGETVFRITGPFCRCGKSDFKVLTPDGTTEVACIKKQFSGLFKEGDPEADHFGITFPLDLDVNMKAVLLGACMLIDFNFFGR